MPMDYYRAALKSGKKDLQTRTLQKLPVELPALDTILRNVEISSEVPLGLIDIPTELIVGTKTRGRTTAFAPNFMPVLGESTEFAAKWAYLCDAHLRDGIRDPIVAYEYMNRYYILEGNKRVSVLKFFKAASIPGYVTRIIPARQDTKESRIYYEFLDFYNATSINYLLFTQPGSYTHICQLVGRRKYERWTLEDRMNFRSCYVRFSEAFDELSGGKLKITAGDAMINYLDLFGYEQLKNESPAEIRTNLKKMWDEIKLTNNDKQASVKLDPEPEQKKNIISKILPGADETITQIAFIHAKTGVTSSWTYAHELGRMHLKDAFHGQIHTTAYDANETNEQALNAIEKAIDEGNKIIFVTTPEFLPASLKAAVNHPDIKILNCSLNTAHKYIRTYYGRIYEAKFLTGMMAGIMTDTDKIGYIADYPIAGMAANINAFAIGAKMVNPKAQIYLEWSTLNANQGVDLTEKFYNLGATYISHQDMITPQYASRKFGLYRVNGETPVNVAFPVWDWGKYYERIIHNIRSGAWNVQGKDNADKSLNYWWGMSAGVIDVVWSSAVPSGTAQLLRTLRNSICRYDFNPFNGILHSQNGVVQTDPEHRMTPEEIISMNWLADNIIGEIPDITELRPNAQNVVSLEGIRKEEE